MAEGDVASELSVPGQRKLKPIVWPKSGVSNKSENLQIVFPTGLSLEKSEAQERAEEEVNQFLNKSTGMMTDVLSLQELKELEIEVQEKIMSANDESMASFGIDDDSFAHLKFSKEALCAIISYVSDLLMGRKSPEEIVETSGANPKKIRYKVEAGAAIAACVHSLAHEMYHARQAIQDPDYYAETLDENMRSAVFRDMSKEKDDVWWRMGFRIYHHSRGERGANAFSVRFLKEFKKEIMLKDDQDRSIVEKLFLSGVDQLNEGLVGEMRERFQKKVE